MQCTPALDAPFTQHLSLFNITTLKAIHIFLNILLTF